MAISGSDKYDVVMRLSTFYIMRWLFNENKVIANRYERFHCPRSTVDKIFSCSKIGDRAMASIAELGEATGLDKRYFTGNEIKINETAKRFFVVSLENTCSWEEYADIRQNNSGKKKRTLLKKYENIINQELKKYHSDLENKKQIINNQLFENEMDIDMLVSITSKIKSRQIRIDYLNKKLDTFFNNEFVNSNNKVKVLK